MTGRLARKRLGFQFDGPVIEQAPTLDRKIEGGRVLYWCLPRQLAAEPGDRFVTGETTLTLHGQVGADHSAWRGLAEHAHATMPDADEWLGKHEVWACAVLGSNGRGRGRPRLHESDAAKQRAYEARQDPDVTREAGRLRTAAWRARKNL